MSRNRRKASQGPRRGRPQSWFKLDEYPTRKQALAAAKQELRRRGNGSKIVFVSRRGVELGYYVGNEHHIALLNKRYTVEE